VTALTPAEVAFSFAVAGKPIGKQRPRLGRNGHVYTPAATVAYERTVRWETLAARPLSWDRSAPVSVTVACYFPDARRRDVDNVLKAVLDAMNGIAYADDCQVQSASVSKQIDRERPRIEIAVRAVT
jgi:Holliday junction resolvase RusA-like endonuclease